jgi:hypothetical protein
MSDSGSYALAIIYQGNLFIVDTDAAEGKKLLIRQITGDGLVNKVDWIAK